MSAVPDDRAKRLGGEDADVLLIDLDAAVVMKARENAAHGFKLEPEVGTDFGARHAQHEFAARIAALFKAMRKREKERGETLFGVHGAQKKHDAVLTHDFVRENFVKVQSHGGHLHAHRLDALVGNDAHVRVFETGHVAGMHAVGDAVHPDPFARHEEVRHGVERLKAVARVIEHFAALDAAARDDEIVERFDVAKGKTARKTGFFQVAVRTGNAEGRHVDDVHFLWKLGAQNQGSGDSARALFRIMSV